MEKAPEFVHTVRAQTIRGIMVDAKELIYRLGWEDIPDEFWQELVHDQYRLAVRKSNWPWIEKARYYAGLRFSSEWVDKVLPEERKVLLPTPPAQTLSKQANGEDRELQPGKLGEQDMVAKLRNPTPTGIQEASSQSFEGGNSQMDRAGKRHRSPVRDFELSEQTCPTKPIRSLMDIDVFEHRGHDIPSRARNPPDMVEPGNLGSPRLPLISSNDMLQESEMRKSGRDRTGRIQKCPVKGCTIVSSNLRKHVELCHIPCVFWQFDTRPEDHVHSVRLRALFRLAQWIVGDQDLGKLLLWANRSLDIARNTEVSSVSQTAMQHLCHTARWPMPTKFTISPINSPAVLLHWRILCGCLDSLQPQQRNSFLADPEGAHIGIGGGIAPPNLSRPREDHYDYPYPVNRGLHGFAGECPDIDSRRDYAAQRPDIGSRRAYAAQRPDISSRRDSAARDMWHNF